MYLQIRKQHEQLKNVASAQTAEANEAQEDVAEFHKTVCGIGLSFFYLKETMYLYITVR
jgi:hypothetical protein